VSCAARLDLVGWATSDGAAYVLRRGYPGVYPPQLVPERLVSTEQRRLELVQVVQRVADQQERASD
jgi:hypothetical protein